MPNATGKPTVIHKSPTPSPKPTHTATAQPTPMPVQVVNGDDPLYTHTIPVIALVVGILGALFGSFALIGIYLQIRRADQANQIGLLGINKTDKAIELAQKDYDATQEALAITRDQARKADEERNRKPDLSVYFKGFEKSRTFTDENVLLEFEIFNAGEVMAENINVEIYFPMKFDGQYDSGADYNDLGMTSAPLLGWRESEEFDRHYVRKHIAALNPRDTAMVGFLDVKIPEGTSELWYFITSPYGHFPRDANPGGFGELFVSVKPPITTALKSE